jgi:hypothetical protein
MIKYKKYASLWEFLSLIILLLFIFSFMLFEIVLVKNYLIVFCLILPLTLFFSFLFFLIFNLFNEFYLVDDFIIFNNYFGVKKQRKIINLINIYETRTWGLVKFVFKKENNISFCIPFLIRDSNFKEIIKLIANEKRYLLNNYLEKIKFKLAFEKEVDL